MILLAIDFGKKIVFIVELQHPWVLLRGIPTAIELSLHVHHPLAQIMGHLHDQLFKAVSFTMECFADGVV